MPYDIHHPACITKILTYACCKPHEPFHSFSRVHPDWYDAIEPQAASAVIEKLNITRTPARWLQNNHLTQFNATPLYPVKEIGSNFMANSLSLERVDFSGSTFESVEVIDDFFLYRCSNLKFVDFSSLTNVVGIARGFCSGSAIESIDLGFAANVNEVLAEFLSSTKLKEIDVSPLHKLEYLPDSFLSQNSDLVEIKGLEKFQSITQIDYGLFLNCTNLKKVDVTFLKNLKKIPSSFLKNCSSLEEIIGLEQLMNVEVIESNFLFGCKSLTGRLDFSGLAVSCHTIHVDGFLSGCSGLTEINLCHFDRSVKNFGDARNAVLTFEGVIREYDPKKDSKKEEDNDETEEKEQQQHFLAVAENNLKNLVLPESFRKIASETVDNFILKKKVAIVAPVSNDDEQEKTDSNACSVS